MVTAGGGTPRASFDRVVEALDQLGLKVTGRRRDERMAQCPAHDDGGPSLHVTYKPGDGLTLLRCFAGCETQLIVDALRLSLGDLYDEPRQRKERPARRVGAARPPRKRVTRPAAAPRKRKPTAEERLGPKVGKEQRVADYPYALADGTVVGRQVRFEQRHERGYTKRFVQEHPDETGEWTSGGWPRQSLYLLPEVAQAVRDGARVLVAEGEKDAETARARFGVVATSNCGGAASWTPYCTEDLAGAREVWVVADRDAAGYLRALNVPRLLVAAGVPTVHVFLSGRADLKDLTDHADAGLGLDDLVEITAGDALRLFLEAGGEDVDEQLKIAGQAAAWLTDRLEESEDALHALIGDALEDLLRRVVEAVPDRADAVAQYLQRAAKAGRLRSTERSSSEGEPEDSGVYKRPRYKVYDDALWRLDKPATAQAPEQWSLLLGCIAEVVRAEYQDNGDEELADPDEVPPTTRYLVRWRERAEDGSLRELGVQAVPADKWAKGDWLAHSPAVAAGIEIPATAIDRGRAAAAIRRTSEHLTGRTPVYTATGWRRRDLGWFYVHAGSGSGRGKAITANGEVDVRTQLSGAAAHIGFAAPPTDRDTGAPDVAAWRAGIAELEYLMDALPARVGAAMVGIAARATLGWTGPSLVFTGDIGAGKTSVATLLASFFDPSIPFNRSRISLAESGGTGNAIRKLTNFLADCIVLIDDNNPDSGTAVAAKRMAFQARAQHEQTERQRSTRDGTGLTSGGKPRGTQVMTGELSPADAGLNSAESRIMSIHLGLGDLGTITVLPELHRQERRDRRGCVLAGLIQWMAPRLEQLRADLLALTGREHPDSYTACFDAKGMPARMSHALADYLVGWRLWLDAAQDAGAIDHEHADRLWKRAFAGLLEAGQSALAFADNGHYDGQLREFVGSALASAEAHFTPWRTTQELSFDQSLACGWKQDPRGPQIVGRRSDHEPVTETHVIPGGRHIGWVDPVERRAYLNPEAALRLCSQMAHQAGSQWDTTRRVVGAALRAANRSRPEIEVDKATGREVRRSERRLRQGERKVAVWDVGLDWLLGIDDDLMGDAVVAGLPPVPGPVVADADELPVADPDPEPGEQPAVMLEVAVGAEQLTQAPPIRPPAPAVPAPAADAAPLSAVAAGSAADVGPMPAPTGSDPAPAAVDPHSIAETAGEAGTDRSAQTDQVVDTGGDAAAMPTGAAGAGVVHEGAHPGDVGLVAHVDRRPVEQQDPCLVCGLPSSTRYGEVVLHIAGCAPPPDLVFDGAGRIITSPARSGGPSAAGPTATVQPAARRPDGKWRALAAVADVDGLHLADGTRVDLPDPLTHLGHLVQAGLDLGLGWGEYDEHWAPERGQVYVTEALAKRLGLPVQLPRLGEAGKWKALARHQWYVGAARDGWSYGQRADQPPPKPNPWTTVWRDKAAGIIVVVPSWSLGDGGQLPQVDQDDRPTPVQLAQRVERFAQLWGLPYRWAPNITGLRRLKHLHRETRGITITKTISMPPPFTRAVGEREVIWHRAPTDAEAALAQVVVYDGNAMYPAAANSLVVGLDREAQHLTDGPVTFNPKCAGAWKVAGASGLQFPGGASMPGLDKVLTVDAKEESMWVSTPMLRLFTEWGLDPAIVEAWVWPAEDCGRVFDTYYKVIRGALTQLPRDGDPETRALRKTVKACANHSLGALAQHSATRAGVDPWWRPDWNRAVVANASSKLLRTVAQVGAQTGRWPLAVRVDCLYYAADDGDPVSVAPEGLSLNAETPGKFKVVGAQPMAEVLAELRDTARSLKVVDGLIRPRDA